MSSDNDATADVPDKYGDLVEHALSESRPTYVDADLLPCPFCGDAVKMEARKIDAGTYYVAGCFINPTGDSRVLAGCGVVHSAWSAAECAAKWNRRATPPTPQPAGGAGEEWAEDRRVIEAATKGPWAPRNLEAVIGPFFHYVGGEQVFVPGWGIEGPIELGNHESGAFTEADATMIARARLRWPAALAELDKVGRELLEVRLDRDGYERQRIAALARVEAAERSLHYALNEGWNCQSSLQRTIVALCGMMGIPHHEHHRLTTTIAAEKDAAAARAEAAEAEVRGLREERDAVVRERDDRAAKHAQLLDDMISLRDGDLVDHPISIAVESRIDRLTIQLATAREALQVIVGAADYPVPSKNAEYLAGCQVATDWAKKVASDALHDAALASTAPVVPAQPAKGDDEGRGTPVEDAK